MVPKQTTYDTPAALFAQGQKYLEGSGVSKDPVKAAFYFQQAAAQGNQNAQSNLGYLYYTGQGVEKDDTQAAHWFSLAAAQGEPNAQCNLAMLLEDGVGIEKDFQKAVYWYEEAAKQNHTTALEVISYLYRTGTTVPRDVGKAVLYTQMLAEQGAAEAQYQMSLYASHGIGMPQDLVSAKNWAERAGRQNHEKAMILYFELCMKTLSPEELFLEAMKYYAKTTLSQLDTLVDGQAASDYVITAANHDYAPAQFFIGLIYNMGDDIAQKYAEGIYLTMTQGETPTRFRAYQQAIDNGEGHNKEEYFLEASHWYERAVSQGHTEAAMRLAAMYAIGQGVARAPEKAAVLYQKVLQAGRADAAECLRRLQGDSDTPSQTGTSV